MPRRGDICDQFNSSMFRYYLRKKYKRHKTFADRMGVSFQVVYAWANGTHKPTWKHVIKIAEIFNISARRLLVKKNQNILDLWEDHLTDYLMSPPELKHETKIVIMSDSGSHTEKKVQRELKLTTKEAIDLTEKLGIFDDSDTDESDDTSKSIDETLVGDDDGK